MVTENNSFGITRSWNWNLKRIAFYVARDGTKDGQAGFFVVGFGGEYEGGAKSTLFVSTGGTKV